MGIVAWIWGTRQEAKEEGKGKREKSKRRGVMKNPIDSRAYGGV